MFTYKTALTLALSAAALGMVTTSASAWEGKVVACYDKHYVPAKYKATKHLLKAKKYKWEHAKHQVVYKKYPAVYVEKKHLVKDEHYVLRHAACK